MEALRASTAKRIVVARGIVRSADSSRTKCALGLVSQFLERPLPFGHLPCLHALQTPEEHLCGHRIMSTSIKRFDDAPLMRSLRATSLSTS